MQQRPQNVRQSRPEGAISGVVGALRIHRPVNQKRTPADGVAVHESPIPAVLTVIAVVAHGEILPGRNDDLAVVDIFLYLRSPLRNRVWRHHLASRRREGVVKGIGKYRRGVHSVWFIEALPVDEHIPVDQLQAITGEDDDPLHEMLVIGVRVLENNDVTALELAVRKYFFVPSSGPPKNKVDHQKLVADH